MSCSERSTGDRDRSLKRRAGLLVKAAASFLVVVCGLRLASGEPLVRHQNEVAVVGRSDGEALSRGGRIEGPIGRQRISAKSLAS